MPGRGQKWYIMIHFMVIKPRHALFLKRSAGRRAFCAIPDFPRERRRGGPMRPPANVRNGFVPRGGFRPLGRVPFFAAKKEPKRRRGWAPMGVPAHSRTTPGPPVTGDTPTPFRKISGAQNTVSGVDSFRATGPWSAQNFGLHHFTAVPGSDQPWQRVRDRGCADWDCSENKKQRAGVPPP